MLPIMRGANNRDLYFIEARSKLIDIAAFLDRVERTEGAKGDEDFRIQAFRKALNVLVETNSERARAVLLAFSDPTEEPVDRATTQAACGAWPGAPRNC